MTEAGVQDLLQLGDEHGLFADVEYSNPMNIADTPDTVVEISANGETFVHRAYALGTGDETDPARRGAGGLRGAATGDWLYGRNRELGPQERFQIENFPDPAPEVGDYIRRHRADRRRLAGRCLGATRRCQRMRRHPRAEKVGGLFADANQLTSSPTTASPTS